MWHISFYHDLVLLAAVKLDMRMRQQQYYTGCPWDRAFDPALLSAAVVELTMAVNGGAGSSNGGAGSASTLVNRLTV